MSDVNSVNVETPFPVDQKTNAGVELHRRYPPGTRVAATVTLRCGGSGGTAFRDVSGIHSYDDWREFVEDIHASRSTVFAVTNEQGEVLGEERIRDVSIVVNISTRLLRLGSNQDEQEKIGDDVTNGEQASDAEPDEFGVETISAVSEEELSSSDARLDAPLPTYQAEAPGRKGWTRINATWPEGGRMLAARLTSYGALIFSPATLDQFGLTSATRCRLHFNSSQNKLGVELLPPGELEEAARRGGTRNVYTTSGSAHVMVTSVLRHHKLTAAANTLCPVVTEQHEGKNLIAIDLKPAVRAASRAGVTLPHRPSASAARRRKPV